MSAKIYEFPATGRFAENDRLDESKPAATLASVRVVKAMVGSGSWYHEEAIREAEQADKN
jgi:hypothetical protein